MDQIKIKMIETLPSAGYPGGCFFLSYGIVMRQLVFISYTKSSVIVNKFEVSEERQKIFVLVVVTQPIS